MTAIPRPKRLIPHAALAAVLAPLAVMTLLSARSIAQPRDTAPDAATPGAPAHTVEFFDERAFALALRSVESQPPQPMPGARALIIPHHWTAGPLIVGPLRDLAATRKVERVILIGPNHTNSGAAPLITSDRSWSTPLGAAHPDREVLAAFETAGVALEPDVLTYEHSVAGIVPAVRHVIPDASITPLVLKSTTSYDDVTRLAAALAPLLADEGTVIVAAVDFSHGLPLEAARLRNAETRMLLERLAASELLALRNEHLDSPAAVAIAIEAARGVGAKTFRLRADTSSAEFAPAHDSVTAYLVGYFR
jgi:AmmeMemoRadiSam system protein B